MSIKFQCSCGKALTARDEYAGRKAQCPACGQVVDIPAPRPARTVGLDLGPPQAGAEAASDSYAVVLAERTIGDQRTIADIVDVLMATMGMIKFDAVRTLKDADGILLSDLQRGAAQQIAEAIQARGHRAGFADAAPVQAIGRPRPIHVGSCHERGLTAQVELSRTAEIPWASVQMLSVVLYHEPERVVKRAVPQRGPRFGLILASTVAFGVVGYHVARAVDGARRDVMSKEIKKSISGEQSYVADIFLSTPPAALRITSRHFNYSYLDDRIETQSELNFHSLISDFARWGKNVIFSPLAGRFLKGDLLLDSVVADLRDFDKYNRWLYLASAAFRDQA